MIEKKCDILVIGGGGSGLVAAARAAEVSGKKVTVLEKTKVLGGGMLFAVTMRTFGSNWQKERNLPDLTNSYMRGMMDLTMWRLDHRLVYNALTGTGEFFDWYASFEKPEVLERYRPGPYVFDGPNGQLGPQLVNGFHNGAGRIIMSAMLRRCEELGAEVLTQHRAVDCEATGGKITAVIAETPEGLARFACKVCILASGSWINDKKVVEEVLPAFNRAEVLPSAHLNPAYTGDGLPIAEKAGARIDKDSFCLRIMGPIAATGETSPFDAITHSAYPILVSLTGSRFAAEPLAPRMDPFDTGHVLLNLPKAKSFFIYSKNLLQRMIEESRRNDGPQDGPFAAPPLPDLAVVSGWFEKEMAGKGRAAMADTPEELAARMGIDPAGLAAAITEYNASCAEGIDRSFCKEPQFLEPLTEGPFYAVAGALSTDGAFGGPEVSPDMQAYAENGGPLDGLYVTGDLASGRHIVMGGVKKQVLNDMSWALASGFIAGSRAGEYVKD